jgi:hypothetical protein
MLENFVIEGFYGHCYFNSELHSMQRFDPPSVPAFFWKKLKHSMVMLSIIRQ